MKVDIDSIIERYYPEDDALRRLLTVHSRCVADKALSVARDSGIEGIDTEFLWQAAMLHDIGICRCDAPDIYCHGTLPYICHGVEGRAMLEAEGLPRHALVCERHTGSGLTAAEIEAAGLPLPHRDMLPLSIEEKIICYADKFYSKSGDPRREKTLEEVRRSMARHGEGPLARFDALHALLCREG